MNVWIASSAYNIESDVSSYCKAFPVEFSRAVGTQLFDVRGNRFLDFLSGCGSLNYGHNEPRLSQKLVDYITSNGVALGLDLHTEAKTQFINTFRSGILDQRGLDYKLQFTGPTGANAIEAAVKLARKITGRTNVISFTNGFHGCSLGALSLTGSSYHRNSSVPLLGGVTHMPYDGYFGPGIDTCALIETLLSDPSSGIDAPAAIILEAVQGEGGLNVASGPWLRGIAEIARRHGALLIVDDIQAGCGRSGNFFSFEGSGVVPDMVVLAKAISGFGLPMSLLLLKPEIDRWQPGEHNGTFRGNCHAFVTASAAIEHFWMDAAFADSVKAKAALLRDGLANIADRHGFRVKGTGLMQGIDMRDGAPCLAVRKACFDAKLIVEACGPHDEILKLMPPLTVSDEELGAALDIVGEKMKTLSGADAVSTSHAGYGVTKAVA